MAGLQHAFDTGRYDDIIMTLTVRSPRSAHEFSLLGLSLLRTGHLAEAETPLTRACVLGDLEASVELGNLLRATGRFEEAAAHFEAITPTLSGELHLRALRWWGVTEFQTGRAEEGVRRCERAWHGYLALGDDEQTARVTQALATMYTKLGNLVRAKQMYVEALHALRHSSNPLPSLTALKGLLDLHIDSGDFRAAHEVLVEAKKHLVFVRALRYHAMVLGSEAELMRLTGNPTGYADALLQLQPISEDTQDHALLVWVTSRLADHHSSQGDHGEALRVLQRYGQNGLPLTPDLVATRGLLARRRGDYASAIQDLGEALDTYQGRPVTPDVIRLQLHLAYALYRSHDKARAVAPLKSALSAMLTLHSQAAFRPDLEELSEILHFAVLEPDLAPYVEPVLDNLANLAGAPRLPEDGSMKLRIFTFGRARIEKDNQAVTLQLRGSVLLLAYIHLHPGKTRQQIQLALYPDKDEVTGANYIRSAIKELREHLGRDVVTWSGRHNAPVYHVGPEVYLDLDLSRFYEALNRGEAAKALALYRGPFMQDIEDSDWVEHKREETLIALQFELRNQMTRYQEKGDSRRVILLANQYLRNDPFEQEVLAARVEAAREVGTSQELAQYVTELNRVYN